MRFYRWIKKEILVALPGFIYFLIVLNILNFSENLYLKKNNLETSFDLTTIFFTSALIGKTLLLLNHLPVINLFPKKALIYNILWKTFLYETSTFFIRISILIYPNLSFENFLPSLKNGWDGVNFPEFLAAQILYLVFFFIFVLFQELTYRLGVKKMVFIFFGVLLKEKKSP